ncbi:MAG: exodeoxyribonuclease VII large subunit [Spirochaetes bacterium]|nr:MAG: exodeoxyribonuclease VII large subunit [Spirochaetota bacterium]
MFNQIDKIYQVSDLTFLIKEILESSFMALTVEGELSNFRPSSTGHWYFTLKDDDAMIQGVMFKGKSAGVRFLPKDGQRIKVKGTLAVYAKRGSYQIICNSMDIAGEGDILAMLERRKQKLAGLGYFDIDKKKQLPLFPSRVAIVSSPTGAALRDILQVLGRRSSGLDVVILPATVQGESAGAEIAAQIKRANKYNLGDVIITGRGGGSLEDLLPFSEENVVMAIAASEIPVISAVGHEIDTVLSDLAADYRAPTPSAAAEIVSASREELRIKVENIEKSISDRLIDKTEKIRILLNQFTPENLERNFMQIIQPLFLRLDDEKEDSISTLREIVLKKRHQVELLKADLESSSPIAILKRGFAVVSDEKTGKLIKSAAKLEAGQIINIRFSKDQASAEIKNSSNKKEV